LQPNLHFYEEILERINVDAHDCMMVGNDVQEDLVAGQLGMQTYLITDHMLNRNNSAIVCDEQGGYEDSTNLSKDFHNYDILIYFNKKSTKLFTIYRLFIII
jgi:FMN phosphatase YigB (HAD superfamily)